MELLRHHDSPHDSIDEEGEQNIAQEYQYPHQDPDKQLLCGIHDVLVEAPQLGYQPHCALHV